MRPLYKAYDDVYTRKEYYRCHYSKTPYRGIYKRIADNVGKEESVVELGSGTGQLMEMLLDNGIRSYIGYDFSQVGLDLAKEKIRERDVQLIYQDLYELTSLPEADVYIAVEVFEHLKDDCDKKLLSLIPKGKKVLISVPSYLGGSHVRKFDSELEIIARYTEIECKKITPVGSKERIFIVVGEKL